jgi:N-formylmaleamate deformylase
MKIVYGERCDGGLAPRAHTIDVEGFRWRYLAWGERGTPFVLWHGITSSADGWWRVGPFLAGLGFQVFAPDLPGHGRSDDSQDYAITTTARLLDSWMAAIGLESPVLLGHSWGGMNALVHATLHDSQVWPRALILEDPAMILPADPDLLLPAYTAGVGTPADESLRAMITIANPRWHPCDAWHKAAALEQARLAAVTGFFRDNAGIDVVDRLRRLRAPAQLLLGDAAQGGLWRAEQVTLVRAAAPDAIIDVIGGSSHNIHRDSWEPFAMALAKFARSYARD